MSQALRKLTGVLAKTNCVAIFINQLRMKIGVMYGNPETTTGGNALKFYSSVRIDVRRTETLKVGGEMVGSATKCKIVKNKVAPPFKVATFDIMYGEGISKEGELLDLGEKLKFVKKSGAWFSYMDTRIGQGRDNAKLFLWENPDVAAELEQKIRENFDKLREMDSKVSKPKKTAAAVAKDEEPEQPVKPAVSLDVSADDFE